MMAKRLFLLSLIPVAFLAYGLSLTSFNVAVLDRRLAQTAPQRFYDYKGSLHIHTSRGAGALDPAQVIDAAKAARNDFIILSDQNQFELTSRYEGYHGRVLCLEGSLLSYLDSRLLYFPEKPGVHFSSLASAQVTMADVLSSRPTEDNRDSVMLAHPFKPSFEWVGEYPQGLTGLEVVNLKSIWQDSWASDKLSFIWSFFIYPFNGRLALLRLYQEPRKELALWDKLMQTQQTVGVLGSHATARTRALAGMELRFPSYELSFGVASNHILLTSELTGDVAKDRAKILGAIHQGQLYFSLDLLGDPQGFAFYARHKERNILPGNAIETKNKVRFTVELPQKPRVPTEIVLIRNGERVQITHTRVSTFTVTEPGVYRVIVRVIPTLPLPDGKRWFTWIYTNPIYVSSPGT